MRLLKGAPARMSTLERFLEFCGDLPLVAHNGSTYDFLLLFAELERVGLAEPLGERLDTLELAHVVFPRAGKRVASRRQWSEGLLPVPSSGGFGGPLRSRGKRRARASGSVRCPDGMGGDERLAGGPEPR